MSEILQDSIIEQFSGIGTEADIQTRIEYKSNANFSRQMKVARSLYIDGGITRAISHIWARDMFTQWRSWTGMQSDKMEEAEEEYSLFRTFKHCYEMSLVEPILIVPIFSNDRTDQPFDIANIKKDTFVRFDISWLTDCSMTGQINTDINDPYYGFSSQVGIPSIMGNLIPVHPSRLIILSPMAPTKAVSRHFRLPVGPSWMGGIIESLTRYDISLTHVINLLQKSTVDVLTIEDIEEKLTGSDGGSRFMSYLQKMRLSMSSFRLLVKPLGQEFERQSIAMAGVDKMQDLLMRDLCAQCGLQATRLTGVTSSGLGSTGEGEDRIHYDDVRARRSLHEDIWRKMDNIVKMSTFGHIPDDLKSTWRALTPDSLSTLSLAKSQYANAATALFNLPMVPRSHIARFLREHEVVEFTDAEIDEIAQTDSEEMLVAGLMGSENPLTDPDENPEKPKSPTPSTEQSSSASRGFVP